MKIKKQIKQLLTNEWIALFFLIVIFLIRQISTISFDLQMGDEGIVVSAFKKVYEGKKLYSEAWYGHGPLAPYVFSFIFHIFGVSLLVVRYASTVIMTTGLIASFFICRRFLTSWWSVVAALVSHLMLFQPLYNYSNIFSLVGGLFGIYFSLKFYEKQSYLWVFLSGFSISISLLQKPIPLGGIMWLALLASLILYRILQKENFVWSFKKVILYYFLGSSIIVVPVYIAIFSSNSLEVLKINLLFFLTYWGPKQTIFDWPNIFSYVGDIFSSRSIMTFFYSLKDIYYSLCFYLPLIMSISTLIYLYKNKNRPNSFGLFVLALISPVVFLQFYYSGGRIGHGGMGFLIPPTIFLLIFFISKLYNFESLKKNNYIVRGVIIIGLIGFYIFPSLYILKTDIREKKFTIPVLNGIRVSQHLYDTIQATTKFLSNNVQKNEKILTPAHRADIFNVILDNQNVLGSNSIYLRNMYSDIKGADEVFRQKILPILQKNMPRAIIFGVLDVPGHEFNEFIHGNYTLSFQAGKFLKPGEPYIDFHYHTGYKVYLKNK